MAVQRVAHPGYTGRKIDNHDGTFTVVAYGPPDLDGYAIRAEATLRPAAATEALATVTRPHLSERGLDLAVRGIDLMGRLFPGGRVIPR